MKRQKQKDIDIDSTVDEKIDTSDTISSKCTTQSTQEISKSARNRVYAQTSRARHRCYVANLERDREILIERLEILEAENRRISGELNELKSKQNQNDDDNTKRSNFTTYTSKSTSTFTSTYNSESTDYHYAALSVLDLLFPQPRHSAKATNSPWPSLLKVLKAPNLFLVKVAAERRESQMNWKGKIFYLLDLYQKKKKKLRLRRAGLLYNLVKWNLYLQQFGNINTR